MSNLGTVQIRSANSIVSTENSTVGPGGYTASHRLLEPNEQWAGTPINIQGMTAVAVAVVTDQPGGLGIEYSMDGDVWDFNGTFPVPATGTMNVLTGVDYPSPTVISSGLRAPWMRVTFRNTGPAPQTVFRLQTMLNPSDVDTGTSRVSNGFSAPALARTVKAASFGFRADGATTPLRFTNEAVPRLMVDAAVTVGGVEVSNFPATQPISGTVTVSNFPSSYPVTGTFWQTTQPVSGTVAVSNLPATQPVSGTVSVSNFPASVEVSNDVGNPLPVSGSVSVSNFPSTYPVTGTFWQATQPVSGTVAVSNFPASQTITGAVTVNNFPASVEISNDVGNAIPVSGTFWQATQPVSGTVAVSNFPATQAVTGTFWQVTQPISGTVAVSNFPASVEISNDVGNAIPVSGTVAVSNLPSTYPVTGTFWQATQPVSGTVTANQGGTWNIGTVTTLTGITNVVHVDDNSGSLTVDGTVTAVPSLNSIAGPLTGTITTTATTADQVVYTYTVPVGKTLLLDGADVSAVATGLIGNILALVSILNMGVAALMVDGTKVWTCQLADVAVDRDKMPPKVQPIPVAATKVVKIVCTPGTITTLRWTGSISGVLV